MTLFRDNFNTDELQARMAFMFGILVTGNIIDNVATPKSLAITL